MNYFSLMESNANWKRISVQTKKFLLTFYPKGKRSVFVERPVSPQASL